jgi:hypothetical protein
VDVPALPRISFGYGGLSRKAGETCANADTSTADVLTDTYDAVGRLLTAADDSETYTLT